MGLAEITIGGAPSSSGEWLGGMILQTFIRSQVGFCNKIIASSRGIDRKEIPKAVIFRFH